MIYKPGQAYYKEFPTSQFTTGAAYDATGTPVATANKNGTDDAAFVLTVANIDTGRYKITGTVPAGYAAGDVVNITVSATVDGVAAKGLVDTFMVDTKRTSDLNDIDGSSVALSAAGVDAILDEVVEGTTTFRQMMRLMAARLFGKATGGGTMTLTYRDIGDSKDRLVYTVDSYGNRSAVTRDGT